MTRRNATLEQYGVTLQEKKGKDLLYLVQTTYRRTVAGESTPRSKKLNQNHAQYTTVVPALAWPIV